MPFLPYLDFQRVFGKARESHLKHLPVEVAVKLAATSYVRHTYTDYDRLLNEGYDRDAARYFTLYDTAEKLAEWGYRLDVETIINSG